MTTCRIDGRVELRVEHGVTLEFESEEGTRVIVRLPGIGDALGIGAEGLASEIPPEW